MARTEKSITGTEKGRPDYTQFAHRAQTFKELKLKPTETLKQYMLVPDSQASPYAFVVSPLSPGATKSLIDINTGASMPITVPAGYDWKVIRLWSSGTEPHHGRMDLDGYYFFQYLNVDYKIYYEQEIEEFHIGIIDPTYANSHTIDIYGKNTGINNLEGVFMLHALQITKGTPEQSDTKTIYCRGCNNTKRVHYQTTKWECPECGTLNLYMAERRG